MSENTNAVRERITRQIRALNAKTVENGCTEAEAIAAADKMADLMAEHGLTMTDAEHQAEKVEQDGIDTGRKVMKAVDLTVNGIEHLCVVKAWWQTSRHSTRRLVILGKPRDSEFALWLYKMIEGAIHSEVNAWGRGPTGGWAHLFGQDKKNACKDFEVGMAHRIAARLHEKARLNEGTAKTASGTSLAVVRGNAVAIALAELGLKFRTGGHGPQARNSNAYGQGQAAGNRVNLDRPLGNSATRRIGA